MLHQIRLRYTSQNRAKLSGLDIAAWTLPLGWAWDFDAQLRPLHNTLQPRPGRAYNAPTLVATPNTGRNGAVIDDAGVITLSAVSRRLGLLVSTYGDVFFVLQEVNDTRPAEQLVTVPRYLIIVHTSPDPGSRDKLLRGTLGQIQDGQGTFF